MQPRMRASSKRAPGFECELAHVFLTEPSFADFRSFFLQEFFRDSGAFLGRGGDARPTGVGSGPFLIEEATFAERRAHEPEIAIADGKHGTNGIVHGVRHTRRFIDDEKRDGGEAADGHLLAREADDARAVGEHERDFVFAVAFYAVPELADELSGFEDELGALALGRADDEDERLLLCLRTMHGFEGCDRRFSPLARAVEYSMGVLRTEDEFLQRIGVKAEDFARKAERIEGMLGSSITCSLSDAIEFGDDGCARFGKMGETSHDGGVVGASRGFGLGGVGLPPIAQHGFVESDDHMGLDSVGWLLPVCGSEIRGRLIA